LTPAHVLHKYVLISIHLFKPGLHVYLSIFWCNYIWFGKQQRKNHSSNNIRLDVLKNKCLHCQKKSSQAWTQMKREHTENASAAFNAFMLPLIFVENENSCFSKRPLQEFNYYRWLLH